MCRSITWMIVVMKNGSISMKPLQSGWNGGQVRTHILPIYLPTSPPPPNTPTLTTYPIYLSTCLSTYLPTYIPSSHIHTHIRTGCLQMWQGCKGIEKVIPVSTFREFTVWHMTDTKLYYRGKGVGPVDKIVSKLEKTRKEKEGWPDLNGDR